MLTRRKLIQYGIRLGAMLSTPFVPAIAQVSARPRMPVEEFSKDAKLVASLRRAVTVMKARPPSDPTSWFFQAAVHAVRNNEIVRVSQQDPGMANVDVDRFWNRCPHFGENAANFPLWHRAYVYYFERILRDAAQDSELSLPYWNYTELAGAGTQDSRRLIPSIFQNPQISGPGSTPNSLHHEWRDFDAGRGISELSFRAVDTTAALASPVFFGGTESEGFAGGVVEIEADANTSGLVERRPHNLVHLFVGDVSAGIGERGMASVPEAAFDSLFWIHHCNIDRLWVQFVGSEGKSWGAIPSTTWLNETPWSFYDHDKTVKMETRAHWMDHRMLGYSYLNEPNPNLSWPTDGPTATAATVAKAARTFRFAASSFRSSDRVVMSSNDISSLVISQEQSRAVQGVASKAVVARPLSGGMERRVILQLLRPHVEKLSPVGFEVFINPSPETGSTTGAAHMIGVIAPFGWEEHGSHHHSGDKGPQFDITEAVADTAMPGGQIRLEFRPFRVSVLLPGATRRRGDSSAATAITFDGFRIFVVERPYSG